MLLKKAQAPTHATNASRRCRSLCPSHPLSSSLALLPYGETLTTLDDPLAGSHGISGIDRPGHNQNASPPASVFIASARCTLGLTAPHSSAAKQAITDHKQMVSQVNSESPELQHIDNNALSMLVPTAPTESDSTALASSARASNCAAKLATQDALSLQEAALRRELESERRARTLLAEQMAAWQHEVSHVDAASFKGGTLAGVSLYHTRGHASACGKSV
jgi:hypothetical protein